MTDPLEVPDSVTRTGHFVFRVWRKDGRAWNWRLRVEAIDSGDSGVFDSMQDALWFMREHLAVDEDVETECDGEPASTDRDGEWLDDSADAAEPMGEI